MTELQVDLYGERIGRIAGDNRAFDFEFDPSAIARLGAGSAALSVSILVRVPPPRAHRERRQNFFTELLPEGRNREWLCAQAGLPYTDVLGLLAIYGRDIAGAIEIWDPARPGEPRTPSLESVTDLEIATTLRDMAAMPLGNVPGFGASSVAGVQPKMVLVQDRNGWHRPLDGYPSTHIVKPADSAAPPTLIWDEEYGARIARNLGLASHTTEIRDFAGTPALVVERYDRAPDSPNGRLHQEDFNQVLGASGDQKYQRPGGKVSLARIARAVAEACGTVDVRALARRTVLAVALGDLDMHAKNLSLLHRGDGTVGLAPAYDVVPQAHHADGGELALAIAGEYRHDAMTVAYLVEEIAGWRVRGADALVNQALEETLAALESEEPLAGAWTGLRDHSVARTKALLSGAPVSDAQS